MSKHGAQPHMKRNRLFWLPKQVMKLDQETVVGGHMGIRKTSDRFTSSFYWPGKMTIIDKPFKRVSVDLIGPVSSIWTWQHIYFDSC